MIPFKTPDKPHTISISTGTFLKTLLIVLGLWFLWFVRDIVAIIFISILLAALIDPFADWFEKHNVPRGIAVILIYIVLAAVLILAFVAIIPVMVNQSEQLLGNLAQPDGFLATLFDRLRAYTAQHGFLQDNLQSTIQSIQDGITSTFSAIFSTVKGFLIAVGALFIVLVLTFYMVVEEETARKIFKNVAPEEYQPYLSQLFVRMQKKVGAWLRGQLVLGFIVGLAVYIGLLIIGVPYALLLAFFAGLFELIPYVGPTFALIPAAIIGFTQSPITGLLVIGLYLLIQQLENNLLVPKIMQKATGLNPIVSIVALLVGIKVGGPLGAILAIPVATMVWVVLEDVFTDAK